MENATGTDGSTRTATGRRGFLSGIVGAAIAGVAAVLGMGTVRFLTPPPLRRRQARKKLDQPVPPLGTVITDTFNDQPIIIYRARSGKMHAYSAFCPHLGCPLEYDPEKKLIICPCHDGVFETTGERVSGPAASSLVSIGIETKGTTIYIMDLPEDTMRG